MIHGKTISQVFFATNEFLYNNILSLGFTKRIRKICSQFLIRRDFHNPTTPAAIHWLDNDRIANAVCGLKGFGKGCRLGKIRNWQARFFSLTAHTVFIGKASGAITANALESHMLSHIGHREYRHIRLICCDGMDLLVLRNLEDPLFITSINMIRRIADLKTRVVPCNTHTNNSISAFLADANKIQLTFTSSQNHYCF